MSLMYTTSHRGLASLRVSVKDVLQLLNLTTAGSPVCVSFTKLPWKGGV
jgi:hypothetical protein